MESNNSTPIDAQANRAGNANADVPAADLVTAEPAMDGPDLLNLALLATMNAAKGAGPRRQECEPPLDSHDRDLLALMAAMETTEEDQRRTEKSTAVTDDGADNANVDVSAADLVTAEPPADGPDPLHPALTATTDAAEAADPGRQECDASPTDSHDRDIPALMPATDTTVDDQRSFEKSTAFTDDDAAPTNRPSADSDDLDLDRDDADLDSNEDSDSDEADWYSDDSESDGPDPLYLKLMDEMKKELAEQRRHAAEASTAARQRERAAEASSAAKQPDATSTPEGGSTGKDAEADALRLIVDRATKGDASILPALRQALAEHPEHFVRAGNLALMSRKIWLDTLTGTDLYLRETVTQELDVLRQELVGSNPSRVEEMMADRVAACWLQAHVADMQYGGYDGKSESLRRELMRRQESAQRRFANSIKLLAQVRKLLP